MSKLSRKRKSLSEQLAELSTPKPVSYHPDEEDLADLTAAKVCEFSVGDDDAVQVNVKRRKALGDFDDDPRYAGKAVSRRDLMGSEGELSDDSADDIISGYESESGQSEQEQGSVDQSDSEDDGHMTDAEQSDASSESEVANQRSEVNGIESISLDSLKEDIAKGKAAKHQIGVWDGLLETRIKLHKVLSACNQLPQGESLQMFAEAGGGQVEGTVENCRSELEGLLDDLLELQKLLLLGNSETRLVVGGADSHSNNNHGDEDSSNEEIPSDFSDDENSDSELENKQDTRKRIGSKRQRHEWVSEDGSRDYESYVSRAHDSFKTYRDNTIAKWNTKTKIASGKITNKSFVQLDHSVLTQIKHILADKPRLLKRTQLKRTVYRVLGRSEDGDLCEGGDEEIDQSESRRDLHLKDYDEEIFDDDDFYHQLLRELIERKMDLSESSDPVAMGRQWLQLQKLRAKAKRKVDTKASKGRKIRYNVHPKLANFMVPIETGTMSDVSKNDLFSSLFGAHLQRLESNRT